MSCETIDLEKIYKENGAKTKYGYYIDFYSCEDEEFYDLRTDDPDIPDSVLICHNRYNGFNLLKICKKEDKAIFRDIFTGKRLTLSYEEFIIGCR